MIAGGPRIVLNSGHAIPQLGIGTYLIPREDTERLVSDALEIGYRHIDTAASYGNEAEIGRAIASSGIPREEIFVTTKLWNDRHAGEEPRRALGESLERLGLDHADLYLIHWPVPVEDQYVHAWHELERFAAEGAARSIGVSNFLVEHLDRLAAESGTTPAVDQIEFHPAYQQPGLVARARSAGIAIEAWSPLGRGRYPVLEEATILAAAAAHGRTPGQVALRWQLQIGNVVFPKTARTERLRENFAILDFELAPEEQEAITALERGGRVGRNPNEVGRSMR